MVHRSTTAPQYRTYETFEERAGESYGYKIDPLYWNKNDRRQGKIKIAILCLIWCIFGAVGQFTLIFWSSKRTQEYFDKKGEVYNRELLDLTKNAMKIRNVESKDTGKDERAFTLYKQQKDDFISNRLEQSRDKPS